MSETMTVNRRTVLASLAAAAVGVATESRLAFAAPKSSFRVSLSVDPFAEQMFAQGITFADGRRRGRDLESLQRLYVAHGATEVYARIRTKSKAKGNIQPGGADHSIERGLERAELARELKLPLNPELGLWGTYGDMGGQPPPDFSDYPQLRLPAPWHTLSIDQMVAILRGYGALVAEQILATGVRVNYWDIGNEVNYGVAGVAISTYGTGGERYFRGYPPYMPPDGVNPEIGKMSVMKLRTFSEQQQGDWLAKNLWPYTGRMFAAVADGVRSVDKAAKFSTHVGPVGQVFPELMVRFFEVTRDNGYLPDQFGTSFYPSINPRAMFPNVDPHTLDVLGNLKLMAKRLKETMQRPLFIAEYGYPASEHFTYGAGHTWIFSIPGYKLTARGQADLTHDIAEWGARTGLLSGLRPWAPGLVTGSWGPMSFFELRDRLAVARASLDAMAQALRHA